LAVELRRIGVEDTAVFATIADEVFDEVVQPDRLRAYLTEPGHLMLVAVEDGIVVGQCAAVVHRHPDKVTELYIDEVGTAPAHHRRGIGRAMVDEMFAWGRELGCEEAWLGTELDNVAANALYRSVGGTTDQMAYWEFDLR
jgi:ribosomal protein S18 acetylase RimI-like enzyme